MAEKKGRETGRRRPPARVKVYRGGCHCGEVRFEVAAELKEVVECNCSICTKKGFLHLIVGPERFTLLSPRRALKTYRFNTMTAKHYFCRRCGIHSFYIPRSHPDRIDVNARCLEGLDPRRLRLRRSNGREWEKNVGALRRKLAGSTATAVRGAG